MILRRLPAVGFLRDRAKTSATTRVSVAAGSTRQNPSGRLIRARVPWRTPALTPKLTRLDGEPLSLGRRTPLSISARQQATRPALASPLAPANPNSIPASMFGGRCESFRRGSKKRTKTRDNDPGRRGYVHLAHDGKSILVEVNLFWQLRGVAFQTDQRRRVDFRRYAPGEFPQFEKAVNTHQAQRCARRSVPPQRFFVLPVRRSVHLANGVINRLCDRHFGTDTLCVFLAIHENFPPNPRSPLAGFIGHR